MAMTNEERFNEEHSNRYDSWIRRSIPGYESLHDMAKYFIKTGMADVENPRLLIAGSGTGMEISSFAAHNPTWTFTGADPSADMTAVARNRVEDLGLTQRVELHTGFVHELPENDAEPFDAATLMLVMHFLPDDGSKLELLESISTRLKPGAPFIHADLYAEEDSPRFSRFVETWMSRQRDTGLSDEDVKKWFNDLRDNVHFITEERIVELLIEAKFAEIERFYNGLLFGGWVARKK